MAVSPSACMFLRLTKHTYDNYINYKDELCNEDNLEQYINYLDEELSVLGYPSLRDENNELQLVSLVNCTLELLNKHQKSSRVREQLENNQRRSASDLQHLKSQHDSLQKSLDKYNRDYALLKEQGRQLDVTINALQKKMKAEKEEARQLQSVLKQRDVQYKHDLKKRDKELEKIKERLHQVISDKKQEKKIGMQILNSIQRGHGTSRAKWNTSQKQEEDMYRLVIRNYEEKQKELMVENSELRKSLAFTQRELVALLNGQPSPLKSQKLPYMEEDELTDDQYETDNASLLDTCASTTNDGITEGHFEMPYELVQEGIENSIKGKLHLLKKRIRNAEKKILDLDAKNNVI